MATLPVTAEDEERERLLRGSELAPATVGGGGGGSSASSTGPATGGTGGLGAPFTGLSSYLAANESSNRALGDKVVGGVQQAGTDARTALGKASTAFNTAAGAGEVRFDQGVTGRLSDAASLANDPTARSSFERMRDASYTGPRTLEGQAEYGDVASTLSKAREQDELSSSESGLGALSDRSVTGQRTAGGRSLDTQLLRGDEGLQGRLSEARSGLAGLAGERDAASAAAVKRAGEGEATSAKTRTDTRSALTAAQDAFDKSLNQRVDQNRLEAFYRGVSASDALKGVKYGEGNLPTTGAQGVYRTYDANGNPVQDVRGAQAGNVPEFIDNTSGQAALPQFNRDLTSFTGAQLASAQTKQQQLADLGLSQAEIAQILDLSGVGNMANASAMGTSNVNPYSYVEDYWGKLGDLNRFLTWTDPNQSITRDNVASAADYGQAGGLATLAGPQLARTQLDATRAGEAGTANLDIVDLDKAGLLGAKNSALADLSRRTAATVQGNARSGSDSYLKQFGRSLADPSTLWLGPLAPLKAAADAA